MCQALGRDAVQLAYLDVTISSNTAGNHLQLRGELDLNTAPRLEQLLDRLRRDGHRQLTLDLSALEFLSAAGLTVFLRVDQALRAVGGRLMLSQPTRMVRRLLAITGLDATLNIQPVARLSMVEDVDLGSGK
jgi:anti-anti-sigma factor